MEYKFVSAEEAVSIIKSNQRIFIHGAAMTPHTLIDALVERAKELSGIDIIHLHTEGSAPYAHSSYKNIFHV